MGKKPDKKGMWKVVATAADLDAALSAEPELIHVAGMPEVVVETPPEGYRSGVQEPPRAPEEPKEAPPKKTTTTVIFSPAGKGLKERRNTRVADRNGMRPRYCQGSDLLDRVMYELFFENLGSLHDKIGSSMRDVVGDTFTGIVSEIEDDGEVFSDTGFRTPPYRVVVKERSLTVEPVSPDGFEAIGEVVKMHPHTRKPLTREEQRGLKMLRVEMDAYAKGGMPELPEREYEPLEKTEHEGLREYFGIQSLQYAVAKTAESRLGGDAERKAGRRVVCRVLEIEYRGKRYRVSGLEMPAFRLVRREHTIEDKKTKEKTTEGYTWAEPVDPAYKGVCFGQVVKNPETGEGIEVKDYIHLKVKVDFDRCYEENPTPPTTSVKPLARRACFE